jgi:hypothetical protein
MIADELFPGFDDDLVAAGASLRSHAESLVFQPYGWGPRSERATKNVGASRLMIESASGDGPASCPESRYTLAAR